LGERRLSGFGEIAIVVNDLSRRWHIESAKNVQERRLARSGWSQQDDELAGEQVEVDISQRFDRHFSHLVDLAKSARDEHRIGVRYGLQAWPSRLSSCSPVQFARGCLGPLRSHC